MKNVLNSIRLHNIFSADTKKISDKISIRMRILGLFITIIILAIGIVAGTTYYIGKNSLESITKNQLNNSVRFVENEITLLSGAYTSREFSDKLGYVLTKEQASFNETGLDALVYLYKPTGEAVDLKNVNAESGNKVALPKAFIDEAVKNKTGNTDLILDGKLKTVSYGYILEKDWIYTVAVTKTSYMKIVYQLQMAALISGVISVLLAIILSLFGTKEIISSIKRMHKNVLEFGKGNLTIRNKGINGGPELKGLAENLNVMFENFESSIKEINDSVSELSFSSNELTKISAKTDENSGFISDVTQSMAQDTQEQQSFTISMREVTDRIIGTIAHIAEKIEETEKTSRDMVETVENGFNSIKELNDKINLIETGSKHTLDYIVKLNEKSNDIDRIANTIKGISAQTKLLSLNASIEAAKAGEFGLGFNVVAGEIQKLAQISAQSAYEVGEIIKVIHYDTKQVIMSAENGLNLTKDGIGIVGKTDKAFRDILDRVSETHEHILYITDNASNISDELHRFSQNEDKILKAITNTAESCQEVASTAEDHRQFSAEISNSASKLQQLADNLTRLKNKFKTA